MILSSRKEVLLISLFSLVLGIISGGCIVSWIIGNHPKISLFLLFLCGFHFLEFFMAALYQFEFSADDFLLDNGWEYPAFILFSSFEYFLKPQFEKNFGLVIGTLLTLMGQILRSLAMYYCREQFAHLLNTAKVEKRLVTKGIYAYIRHPSYLGFFLWTLGLQLVLGNVLCFFAAIFIMWKFFSERIKTEEAELIRVFGGEYLEYRNKVFTGIPGIA